VNVFIPRLVAFAFCLIAFGVGIYFQRQERIRREQKRQMTASTTVGTKFAPSDVIISTSTVGGTVGGIVGSMTQAVRPTKTQQKTEEIGSLQGQQQGQSGLIN
jgi:hypothetical protein